MNILCAFLSLSIYIIIISLFIHSCFFLQIKSFVESQNVESKSLRNYVLWSERYSMLKTVAESYFNACSGRFSMVGDKMWTGNLLSGVNYIDVDNIVKRLMSLRHVHRFRLALLVSKVPAGRYSTCLIKCKFCGEYRRGTNESHLLCKFFNLILDLDKSTHAHWHLLKGLITCRTERFSLFKKNPRFHLILMESVSFCLCVFQSMCFLRAWL